MKPFRCLYSMPLICSPDTAKEKMKIKWRDEVKKKQIWKATKTIILKVRLSGKSTENMTQYIYSKVCCKLDNKLYGIYENSESNVSTKWNTPSKVSCMSSDAFQHELKGQFKNSSTVPIKNTHPWDVLCFYYCIHRSWSIKIGLLCQRKKNCNQRKVLEKYKSPPKPP